jgi:L-seryl-tRNA(Ser) seleniumtransferase
MGKTGAQVDENNDGGKDITRDAASELPAVTEGGSGGVEPAGTDTPAGEPEAASGATLESLHGAAGRSDAVRQALRALPGVDGLLETEHAGALLEANPRDEVVKALRHSLEAVRRRILAGTAPQTWSRLAEPDSLVEAAAEILERWSRPHLRRVLNATGVVIHTNLGRSALAEEAIERVVEVARHYSTLEYDLASGARGSRHDHVDALLCRLTGAQGAMVVNNNAAAVLMVVAALASGREVVVSRGQLVEIGGSFRIPDIMRLSGARLVEVGTTNRTRIADYEAAVTENTALLLRVHTSNFKVVGFAEETPIEELVALGRLHGIPVADDMGSGALVDLPVFRDEPSATASLQAGVSVAMFSGDKLLGGPQAGILLGTADTIERLKKHPFARAARVDKMTLAALEGTLHLYRDPERARAAIPTLRCLARKPSETGVLAARLLTEIRRRCEAEGVLVSLSTEPSVGRSGGGTLPLLEIPSHAVVVRPRAGSVVALEAELREAPLPVVGRVTQDALYLDVLALSTEELPLVADSVVWALQRVACTPACETARPATPPGMAELTASPADAPSSDVPPAPTASPTAPSTAGTPPSD